MRCFIYVVLFALVFQVLEAASPHQGHFRIRYPEVHPTRKIQVNSRRYQYMSEISPAFRTRHLPQDLRSGTFYSIHSRVQQSYDPYSYHGNVSAVHPRAWGKTDGKRPQSLQKNEPYPQYNRKFEIRPNLNLEAMGSPFLW